ncbi:hypothetical protein ACS0TY_026590 [Phlomoides rotata]
MEALVGVESKVINVDDIEEAGKESYLVGRLVTEKNLNLSNLIGEIKKSWKPKYGMRWKEWGESKLILFGFDGVMDRDWVLKNQPWHFNASVFAIKKMTRREQQLSSSVNVVVKHTSFYARLYDVPFSCMNETSLGRFAKQIDILESVDVSINITKPLLRGINILVKGKHLWLPLKYESLPIYCFSCGTVGHDHNSCRSYSPNLKYSTLELRASSSKTRKTIDGRTLPHDIMENILSRLPVKYLIRYKSVCKLWEATISDPRFAEIHLQQYKNSSSRSLLAFEQFFNDFTGFYVVEVQDRHFQFVSRIQLSREYSLSYDIFVLLGYKEICCPQPIKDTGYVESTLYGIYYNPHVKDYKVVIAGMKHYAVFSGRYNEWSEVKEMKDIFCRKRAHWVRGVSFTGSFYWLSVIESKGHFKEYEIIWFDGKVESFKKLPMPNRIEKFDFCYLTSSGAHLCLFMISITDEVSIWRNVNGNENDSWMEFRVHFDFNYLNNAFPVCWLNEFASAKFKTYAPNSLLRLRGSRLLACDLNDNLADGKRQALKAFLSATSPVFHSTFLQELREKEYHQILAKPFSVNHGSNFLLIDFITIMAAASWVLSGRFNFCVVGCLKDSKLEESSGLCILSSPQTYAIYALQKRTVEGENDIESTGGN